MASMVIPNRPQAGNGRISEPKTKPPKGAERAAAGGVRGRARKTSAQRAGRKF